MKEEVEEIFATVIDARKNAYKAFKSLIDGIIKERNQLAKKANNISHDRHSHMGPAQDFKVYDDAFANYNQATQEQTIKLEEAISTARRLGFDDMVQKVAGELEFDPVTLEPTKAALRKKYHLATLSGL